MRGGPALAVLLLRFQRCPVLPDTPWAPGIFFRVLRAHVHPEAVRRGENLAAMLASRGRVFSWGRRSAPFAMVARVLTKGAFVFIQLATVRALDAHSLRGRRRHACFAVCAEESIDRKDKRGDRRGAPAQRKYSATPRACSCALRPNAVGP